MTRLEKAMADIAARHAELNGLAKVLLDAQIKTENPFQETDKHIEKLVSAIG